MTDMPKIAWFVLALGIAWLVLRVWARKAEDRRVAEREARLAELYAERERILKERKPDEAPPPSSLRAVVSDSEPPKAAPKEQVCLGCRTINEPSATTCAGCRLEL